MSPHEKHNNQPLHCHLYHHLQTLPLNWILTKTRRTKLLEIQTLRRFPWRIWPNLNLWLNLMAKSNQRQISWVQK